MVVVGCVEPRQLSPVILKNFCKTPACPSSEKLLSYRRQQLPLTERLVVESHLTDCDFCSAELELLKRYRTAEKLSYRLVEMPSGFRRIVEDLLQSSATRFLGASDLTGSNRLIH